MTRRGDRRALPPHIRENFSPRLHLQVKETQFAKRRPVKGIELNRDAGGAFKPAGRLFEQVLLHRRDMQGQD